MGQEAVEVVSQSGEDEPLFQPELLDPPPNRLAQRTVAEVNEPDPCIGAGHDRRGLDKNAKPLFGAEPAGRSDDPLWYPREHPLQHAAIRRIGMIEPLGADRVADDDHPVGPHAARRTFPAWPSETQTTRSILRRQTRSRAS